MSFKRLNDIHREEALVPFLDAANRIPGVLLLVAFRKVVSGLLDEKSDRFLFSALAHWKPAVREELFRILCLVSLLIAGLSRPGQDALWLSDEDAILANSARMQQMAPALLRIASGVVPHGMGHLKFATAAQDKGDLNVEDLVAVPDLAAGALLNFLQEDRALTNDVLPLDRCLLRGLRWSGRKLIAEPLERTKLVVHQARLGSLRVGVRSFRADSQVPWGVPALEGAVTHAAWRTKPSRYVIASDDRTIPPPAQRAMSARANASVGEVKASHALYQSPPAFVATAIERASSGTH
jgi:hypothetical protein